MAWSVFHLFGGWTLSILGIVILIFSIEKILKLQIFTTKHKLPKCSNSDHLEKKPDFCFSCGKILRYAAPIFSRRDLFSLAALILGVILIINIQVPVFAFIEGSPTILVLRENEITTGQILPEVPDYTLQFSYRDKEFEQAARRDAALLYAYTPTENPENTIWVTLEISSSRSVYHPWEASVSPWPQTFAGGAEVEQLDLRDAQLFQNPIIIGRFFAYRPRASNMSHVVLYWFENALFDTGSSIEQKHVKIGLVFMSRNIKDSMAVSGIEELLLKFGKAIVNYWQPVKTWSQISLTVIQNTSVLIVMTVVLTTTILAVDSLHSQMEKRSKQQLYRKIALEDDEIIFQAVNEASKKEQSTGDSIASYYRKRTGKSIELGNLFKRLTEAEEVGFVKREVASLEDEPIIVWKIQHPSKLLFLLLSPWIFYTRVRAFASGQISNVLLKIRRK